MISMTGGRNNETNDNLTSLPNPHVLYSESLVLRFRSTSYRTVYILHNLGIKLRLPLCFNKTTFFEANVYLFVEYREEGILFTL